MKAKKQFKLRALNAAGVSHLLVPLLVIVTIAVGGTFMVVASHANNGVLGDSTAKPSGNSSKNKDKTKKSKIKKNVSKLILFSASYSYKGVKITQGTDPKTAKPAKCGIAPTADPKTKAIMKTPSLSKSVFTLPTKRGYDKDPKNYYPRIVICDDAPVGSYLYATYTANPKPKKSKFLGSPVKITRGQSCVLVHHDKISANLFNFLEGKCVDVADNSSFLKPASLPPEPDDAVTPTPVEQQ